MPFQPAKILKRLDVDHGSHWINDDVRPLETARRTWTAFTFQNFWLLINCNIATYLTGSALIPLGLVWWQAIIAIVIGSLLGTAAVLLASLTGAHYHIGFSVFNRAVWGMWGGQFVIWNRIFLSLVWYGFQSWIGGECIYLILLSWDPNLEEDIPNTIPASTGMTSAQFVAYFIFCIISLPIIWIPPHRMEKFFTIACSVTLTFFVVLLIWALATMGPGGFGSTIETSTTSASTGGSGPWASTAWLMVYGIMSTIGSIAAGILNQNDYSRLARRPRDAILGQAFAFPIYSIFTSVLGILVTAATQNRLGGDPVWNPPTLFAQLLAQDPTSSGTRAAVFFAGLALTMSQIGSNVPGNAMAGGIDLASVLPRYITLRRGAYITAILSPLVNPWRLVNTATIFLTVLSGYGVFLAPMTGVMVASYLVVNKQRLKLNDLYHGDATSIYWFTGGVNWRAPVAWSIGVAPCLPGFIAAVNTSITIPAGATELYMLNYLYGFLVSGTVYAALHRVFPAERLDDFVRSCPSAKVVRRQYEEEWEAVGLRHTADAVVILGRDGVAGAHSAGTLSNVDASETGGDAPSSGRERIDGVVGGKFSDEKSAREREREV